MKCVPMIGAAILLFFVEFRAGQSADLREELLAKAKEVYGDQAPSQITFVTAGTHNLGLGGLNKAKDSAATKQGTQGDETTAMTKQGDSATGVILESKGDQVFLDSSPCNGKVMVFTQPYSKTNAGPATCGDKTIPRFKLVQK